MGVASLAALALVPFAVGAVRERNDGPRRAFRGGLLLGALAWALLLHWIPLSLTRFSVWAPAGWLLVVAILAVLTGGVAVLLQALLARGWPVWLALPLAWTAGEWLRASAPFPLAFPWLPLAAALAPRPLALGVAELVGERGVGLLLALVNGLLAAAWLRWRPAEDAARGGRAGLAGRSVKPIRARERRVPGTELLAAAAVVTGALGWGAWRASTLPLRPGPRLAVIQPSVPQEVKLDADRVGSATFDAVENLLARVTSPSGALAEPAGPVRSWRQEGPPDLAVLPEALLPQPLDAPASDEIRARLRGWADALGSPLLVGGIGAAAPGEGPANAVFLVRPETGLAPGSAAKRHLVPAVERLPLLPLAALPPLAGVARSADRAFGSYGPGGIPPLLRVRQEGARWVVSPEGPAVRVAAEDGFLVGTTICWEAVFAGAARDLRRRGADVLVNVSNDAWFGAPGPVSLLAPWRRTAALAQHPAHLVLRAVETRAPVARAANTGRSFFVDPLGRVHDPLPSFEPGLAVHRVQTSDVRTLFVRTGDLVGPGAAAVLFLLILLSGGSPAPARGTGLPARRS